MNIKKIISPKPQTLIEKVRILEERMISGKLSSTKADK